MQKLIKICEILINYKILSPEIQDSSRISLNNYISQKQADSRIQTDGYWKKKIFVEAYFVTSECISQTNISDDKITGKTIILLGNKKHFKTWQLLSYSLQFTKKKTFCILSDNAEYEQLTKIAKTQS